MSEQKKKITPSPDSAARNPKGRQKRRRINRLRVGILLFVIILIVAVVSLAVMFARSPGKSTATQSGEDSASLFGVKSVVVEGNTHYTDEQIVKTSSIYVGQSLFFVNKKHAAQNILQSFPYVEKVTVSNPSFSQIKISIQEAQPVGVIGWEGSWLIVGKNGKGLEQLPVDSERLPDYRQLKCTVLDGGGLGHLTLDTRSLTIINTLTAAFSNYKVENIRGIDLADYTDIRLNWKDQITVKLGSDANLDHEISTMATTLGRVLKSNGEDAHGQLDLSSYADSNSSNDMTVFTPEDLLIPSNTGDTGTTGASTTTTTAAG